MSHFLWDTAKIRIIIITNNNKAIYHYFAFNNKISTFAKF